jgi:hypothetical protein
MKRDSCRAWVVSARAEKGGKWWQDREPLPGFLAGVPLEVRMPPRIGTFLAIIIPTSISSYRAHDAPAAGSHFALA